MSNNNTNISPILIWSYYLLLGFCIALLQINWCIVFVLAGDRLLLNVSSNENFTGLQWLTVMYALLIYCGLKWPWRIWTVNSWIAAVTGSTLLLMFDLAKI